MNIASVFIIIGGLLLIGIITFYYKSIIKSIGSERSIRSSDDNETDLDKLKKIAEKKIKSAQRKGIDTLVCDLYFKVVKNYPFWMKNKGGDEHKKSIISFAKNGKTKEKNEFTEININNKKFKFIYSKNVFYSYVPEYEKIDHNLLELFYKNKKVFGVRVDLVHPDDSDMYFGMSTERYGGIESFLDGDWIDDLRMLKSLAEKDREENDIKRKADSEKEEAKRLKKNFGI